MLTLYFEYRKLGFVTFFTLDCLYMKAYNLLCYAVVGRTMETSVLATFAWALLKLALTLHQLPFHNSFFLLIRDF